MYSGKSIPFNVPIFNSCQVLEWLEIQIVLNYILIDNVKLSR